MKKLLLISILLFPTSAYAQIAGGCPPGTNNGVVRSGTVFRIYWCQPNTPNNEIVGAKVSGLPAGTIQLNDVRKERGPFTEDNTNQWSGMVPAQPRGNYTIIVFSQNHRIPGDANTVQDSKGSAPFALGVVDGFDPPDTPTRIRSGDAGYPATSAKPDPPSPNRAPPPDAVR